MRLVVPPGGKGVKVFLLPPILASARQRFIPLPQLRSNSPGCHHSFLDLRPRREYYTRLFLSPSRDQ